MNIFHNPCYQAKGGFDCNGVAGAENDGSLFPSPYIPRFIVQFRLHKGKGSIGLNMANTLASVNILIKMTFILTFFYVVASKQ